MKLSQFNSHDLQFKIPNEFRVTFGNSHDAPATRNITFTVTKWTAHGTLVRPMKSGVYAVKRAVSRGKSADL